MGTLGRLFHFSFDLVLVSTVLAGIKRSTGLTIKTGDFENKDTRSYIERYLDVGDIAHANIRMNKKGR
ncbi:hypothetical protein CJU89_2029 [Yarrowia sp. B02]|nr:hypothetical protein CJU89_2029 [Yarrowia sp. B02]